MPEQDPTVELVRTLVARGLTIAVAESLTGGELTAELTRPAGASAAVNGGVVVYHTEIKHSVIGVDAQLLAEHGPVHPEVAVQLAQGARRVLAVGGRAAAIGVGITGVAGPDPQGGRAVGTVFVGIALGPELTGAGESVRVVELALTGDRAGIRRASVRAAVDAVRAAVV